MVNWKIFNAGIHWLPQETYNQHVVPTGTQERNTYEDSFPPSPHQGPSSVQIAIFNHYRNHWGPHISRQSLVRAKGR